MVGICRQAFMIIVMTLIITTVMIITMVIRELLRFSCGEVAPSGGVKGIGTVALLSNSLPSMLVMIMTMMVVMVVMVMMVVLVEYHDQSKMLSHIILAIPLPNVKSVIHG